MTPHAISPQPVPTGYGRSLMPRGITCGCVCHVQTVSEARMEVNAVLMRPALDSGRPFVAGALKPYFLKGLSGQTGHPARSAGSLLKN